MVLHSRFIFVVRILAYILGLVLLCIAVLACGLSSERNFSPQTKLTPETVSQARKILYEGTKVKPDEIAAITVTEADLNLAGNYLLNHFRQSVINIELINQKIRCDVSLTLPSNPFANYFNVSFRLSNETNDMFPRIVKFKVGKLLLPVKLADWIIHTLIRNSFLNDYFILATTPIQRVEIVDKTLTIFYETNSQHHLTNAQSRQIYQQKIAEVVAKHDLKWRLSLAELLKPVFELVYERSTLETAIEENRSAILAVNDYVNAIESPQQPPFLYKRTDLAQHFIGAATLAASMNSYVANALGEVKELSDSQAGGSGFSFIDLAADKAGSRFGDLAVSSPENARRIQKLTAQINDYGDFMPDPRDLPEHMSDTQFKRIFGSTQSPMYTALAAKINDRIERMPLYQTTHGTRQIDDMSPTSPK